MLSGLMLAGVLAVPPGFAARQNVAPRVVEARARRAAQIQALFDDAGVAYPPRHVLLRAFKHERELELWAGGAQSPMRMIKRYPICASSGDPGPKRRRGDLQVPEGFYHVNRFNPSSSFHLALGINYPNDSDRILGRKIHQANLGGDIMVHGDCVTIGCIPIEDDPIEELYVIALDTFLTGRQINVHVFPQRMDAAGMAELELAAAQNPALRDFWRNLRPVYEQFEAHRTLPRIRVDKQTGRYRLR